MAILFLCRAQEERIDRPYNRIPLNTNTNIYATDLHVFDIRHRQTMGGSYCNSYVDAAMLQKGLPIECQARINGWEFLKSYSSSLQTKAQDYIFEAR